MHAHKKFWKGVEVACLAGSIVLFAGRCSFKKPSAPDWDVVFTLPLINEIFTISEIAEDNDHLNASDQDVIVSFDDRIDPIAFRDYLKISDSQKNLSIPVPMGKGVGWETTQSEEILMPNSIVVDEAAVRHGQLEIQAYNTSGYQIQAEISIPSLTQNGSILPLFLNIGAGKNATSVFPLQGCFFRPPHSGGHNVVPYHTKIQIKSISTGTAGTVNINVRIADLAFESITGRFNDLVVALEADTIDIDIPEAGERFKVEKAALSLILVTDLAIPVTFDLWIEAMEWSGSSAPAPIHTTGTTAGTGLPDTLSFSANVAEFINSRPERILVHGNFKLGSSLTSVSVNGKDTINGTLIFSAPLIFALSAQAQKMDVDTLEIDKDARKTIRENLLSGNLDAKVENALPLGASVTLFFSKTRADSMIYDLYDLKIGPLTVRSAPTSGNPGTVTGAVTSDLDVALTKDQLRLFEDSIVYMGIYLTFSGTGNKMVRIRPSDYIGVKASLTAQINTTVPEEDE
ncbi:MAG TPA: hypothetical protein PK843_15165 [bacterium]|nr:hypothetical protein [bacterium]